MPRRGIWEGSIGFGLVNVPVAMVPATRDQSYRFRELDRETGAPVRHRRFCAAENVEVGQDEIGRGYELDDGEMVVMTDEELESVAPEKTRTIEIESFTRLDEIDPLRFDRPYYLVPKGNSGGTLRAYHLLVEALAETGKVALGRFVMRTREYLAAVREHDGALALSTMLFADEVRPFSEVPQPDETEADPDAVKNAVAVVDELTTEWDHGAFRDCYRERLAEVIEERRKGHTVTAPEPADEEPTPAPDLIAALRETLEAQKQGGKSGARKKRSRPSGSGQSRSRGSSRKSGSRSRR